MNLDIEKWAEKGKISQSQEERKPLLNPEGTGTAVRKGTPHKEMNPDSPKVVRTDEGKSDRWRWGEMVKLKTEKQ